MKKHRCRLIYLVIFILVIIVCYVKLQSYNSTNLGQHSATEKVNVAATRDDITDTFSQILEQIENLTDEEISAVGERIRLMQHKQTSYNWGNNNIENEDKLRFQAKSTDRESSFKHEPGNSPSKPMVEAQTQDYRTPYPLDVFIIEEHHEALPYWFKAAETSTIPKSGNTLFHIDGHSDMSQTFSVPGYPLFRWPGIKELTFLMQRNDAFIQAAAMAGLLDRVIWVWPDWDMKHHDVDYVRFDVGLGSTKKASSADLPDLCNCYKYGNDVQCQYTTLYTDALTEAELNEYETTHGISIPEANCSIHKSLVYEVIHEKTVEDYLRTPGWIKETESVILDLDEDFYGCAYAIEPLLESKMTETEVESLNSLVKSFLCPVSSYQDQEYDSFLSNIILAFYCKRICDKYPKYGLTIDCCNGEAQKAANENILKQLKKLMSTNLVQLCSAEQKLTTLMSALFAEFGTLSLQQLRSLYTVGFCSNTSPKTFPGILSRSFGICIGANTPNHTVVNTHKPTALDVQLRTLQLKRIIDGLSLYSPKLVTLCRSVRDGYTPRQYFRQIENDMINVLNTSLNKRLTLHYDLDLLGGKEGWGYRLETKAILNAITYKG